MPLIAVYDANVLYPSTLRDVLIRGAIAGLVQAKWTDQILDETFRNVKANRPDLSPERLDRTRLLHRRRHRGDLAPRGVQGRHPAQPRLGCTAHCRASEACPLIGRS
jgi:hypothetical protein